MAEGRTFDFRANWSDTDHGAVVYHPDRVDPDEYRAFLDWSYRRFYLRPGHLLRTAASIRSLTQARGYVAGAAAILGL